MKYVTALNSLKNLVKQQNPRNLSLALNLLENKTNITNQLSAWHRFSLNLNLQHNSYKNLRPILSQHYFSTSTKQSVIEINNHYFSMEKSHKTFNDIGGLQDVKNQCEEIIDFLKNYKNTSISSSIPKGIILKGSSNIGKSNMAFAIAAQANVLYMDVDACQLIDIGMNGQEKLFKHLEQFAPCVLVVKNIDLLTELSKNTNIKHLNAINNFLKFIDKSENIVVIGTTSAQILADKLVKPGRFEQILMRLPTELERCEIIAGYLRQKPLDNTVNLERLGSLSSGFSDAKIQAWIEKASRMANINNSRALTNKIFIDAFIAIQRGCIGSSHISLEKKHAVAIHEAGHALIAHKLGFEVIFATILKANDEGVNSLNLPDEYQNTRTNILSCLAILLGGRAAETVKNHVQLGSQDDLQKVKKTISHMMEHEGMGACILGSNCVSDAVELANSLMKHVIDMIKENEYELDNLINALVEHEVIYGDDIGKICKGENIQTNNESSINKNNTNYIVKHSLFNQKKSLQDVYVTTFGKLTKQNTAAVLKIEPEEIDYFYLDLQGNLQIHLVKAFDDHRHFEEVIEDDLLDEGIESYYVRQWCTNAAPYLRIENESKDKFIAFAEFTSLQNDNSPDGP